MRYSIKSGKVVESLSIDAPYDTQEQAQHVLENENVYHNDETGHFEPWIEETDLYSRDRSRGLHD